MKADLASARYLQFLPVHAPGPDGAFTAIAPRTLRPDAGSAAGGRDCRARTHFHPLVLWAKPDITGK